MITFAQYFAMTPPGKRDALKAIEYEARVKKEMWAVCLLHLIDLYAHHQPGTNELNIGRGHTAKVVTPRRTDFSFSSSSAGW